jgi:hypothetical protein
VEDWVRIGSPAKNKVKKEHASVPFDDQCSILEKVRNVNARTHTDRMNNGLYIIGFAHQRTNSRIIIDL